MNTTPITRPNTVGPWASALWLALATVSCATAPELPESKTPAEVLGSASPAERAPSANPTEAAEPSNPAPAVPEPASTPQPVTPVATPDARTPDATTPDAAAPDAATPGATDAVTRPTVTSPAPAAVDAAARSLLRRIPASLQAYAERDDVTAFARQLEVDRGIDARWTVAQLDDARYLPKVAQLMLPPPAGTAKDWGAYRARFVEPKRIAAGAAFWRANEAALERAQARWGVPPWLVVGIVGVETYYGRITGNFRVIDALATLSFDFPVGRKDRSAFFTTQLAEYLHWCRNENLDPATVLGSYAGAIGLPQFMPGSINRWAVDFDGDGHIDLQRNHTDVVGSVAHYMAAHGWQRDMPATYDVLVPSDSTQRATLLAPDIVPTFSPAQMQAHGAVLRGRQAREHIGPLALVELSNGDKAPSYVAGTENFYVVTRYNWSSYYAMAVIDLGRAVETEVRRASGDGASNGSSRRTERVAAD